MNVMSESRAKCACICFVFTVATGLRRSLKASATPTLLKMAIFKRVCSRFDRGISRKFRRGIPFFHERQKVQTQKAKYPVDARV